MIGRLRGILLEKKPPQLLIDVSGVAYELQAPMSTFYLLPEINQQLVLHTHLVIREDSHQLYGFFEERERSLFRTLIKINNIGPKSALTILSGIEPNAFIRCIMENDAASLSRLPGIGKKTAERLIVEMKDRLSNLEVSSKEETILKSSGNAAVQDAISALVALGYKQQDARQAIARIEKSNLSSEELIRLALQHML